MKNVSLIGLLLGGACAGLVAGCEPAVKDVPPSQNSNFTLDINTLNLPDSRGVNSSVQISPLLSATPYSALIKEERISISSYEGPDDDYYTKVKTITGQVLETYRGDVLDSVTFEWALENADDTTARPAPYIITLCKRNGMFYRQEVAADIKATPESIEAARALSLKLDSKQTNFSDCD